jgi:hypothetical protein
MAYALIAHTAQEGNSTTVTSTGITTTGSTLIVVGCANNSTAPPQITDSNSNVWALMQPLTTSGGSTAGAIIFWCVNPIVGASHTFTVTSAFPSICVTAWSGAAGYLDKRAGATQTTGGSLAPGSITPSAANALVVSVVGASQNDTLSINASYAISDQVGGTNAQRAGLGYLIQTSAAAASPTWTLSLGTLPSASVNVAFELGASAAVTVGYGFAG